MADSSKKMQIVFASAECAPFVKTGGLGDVAGSLPAALVRAGAEVIVMVPKYATIKDEYKAQMEHFADFYVSLGWRNEYCGLEKLERDGVTYMFVDNERYFARDYPYGFFDDGERFAFFSKAITESLQHLPAGFECDILHCNDWQTALAPVFLREFYQGLPLYDRVKTVFSIHNVAFQGQFSDTVMEDIPRCGAYSGGSYAVALRRLQYQLHAGRAALCRCHHHGEPHLCGRDPDARVWRGPGRRAARALLCAAGHPQRH